MTTRRAVDRKYAELEQDRTVVLFQLATLVCARLVRDALGGAVRFQAEESYMQAKVIQNEPEPST